MSGAQLQALSPEKLKSWIEGYDTFIFDCDGVVWVGDKLIPGECCRLCMKPPLPSSDQHAQ